MKVIDNKDLVKTEILKVYDNIDGFEVIKELLLFKGIEIITMGARNTKVVMFKDLEKMAYILYGLKVNSTNKLYVGFYLDRFYRKNGLIANNKSYQVKVPENIFAEAKKINDSYTVPFDVVV